MCTEHPELQGMGTTPGAGDVPGETGSTMRPCRRFLRLYRMRYGRMRRLTRDHS